MSRIVNCDKLFVCGSNYSTTLTTQKTVSHHRIKKITITCWKLLLLLQQQQQQHLSNIIPMHSNMSSDTHKRSFWNSQILKLFWMNYLCQNLYSIHGPYARLAKKSVCINCKNLFLLYCAKRSPNPVMF